MKNTIPRMTILVSLLLIGFVAWSLGDYPSNEYDYSLRREQLIQAELAYEGKKNTLTKDEELVDHYLQHLKWAEFEKTRGRFLPSLSLNETIMKEVMESDVYKALLKLPKGGSMHSHENHEVSKRTLLDIVWNSSDFKYLWVTDPEENPPDKSWRLQFGINSPKDDYKWIKVDGSNYTKDEILGYQSLFGILSDFARANPTNAGQRWVEMNPLWGRASGLIDNIEIKKEYLKAMYKKNLDEGVQYIESRKNVGGLKMYKVDPTSSENNGIVYLETDENVGELEINTTQDILDEFIKQNPSFIGHKRITYSTRRIDPTKMQNNMDKAIALHNKYPNHLLGFDMVGEEDAGNSHIFFLENFMKAYDLKTHGSKIPFFQHTAETNWPKDLITSGNDEDPVATIQNAYEAILLGSKRVGHGLGYIKHPYLLRTLKEKDVAVEICPISNQILGYTVDLRNHPAVNYIRNGVPVVLGTDDPGTFGYDHFTIDWYSIFMAWGLDLSDMKHLATNAIRYSGMSKDEKADATAKFNQAWEKYISDTKATACASNYNSGEPATGRILPREGLKSGGTKVHVFGRRFDKAIGSICQGKIAKCRFGQKESDVKYISNNHLICESPPQDAGFSEWVDYAAVTVNVSISLEDGQWLDTGEQFTYSQDPPSTTPTANTASPLHRLSLGFVCVALALFGLLK